MRIAQVTLKVGGTSEAVMQRVRGGLASRSALHARLATTAAAATQQYLRDPRQGRHATAQSLGAKPTNHMARSARGIQSDSSEEQATVRIPRATGLGRAFRDLVILPGSGKVFLALAADAKTYGKSPREFPFDSFVFSTVGGRYPALMWRKGWTVAYWLARSVTQKQDRTLLPSNKAYAAIGRGVTLAYFHELIESP